MKKILALFAAIAALASCTVKEPVGPERTADSPILHASFEGLEATRTFVGEDLRLFWTADDRISVFPGTTDNLQYRFLGGTGDRSGDFEEVTPSGARTGSGVDAIYAVYPYQPAACLSADGAVTVDVPAVQQYAPGTFGLGANTMVAVSSDLRDDFLYFRNVCGYIVVRLYGDETVKSIMFKGNDGERIAGRGTVRASHSAAPAIVMADDATTSITIDCGEGVKLGASADAATEFWFCVPPVTFAKGFSITVTNTDGLRMTKSLNSSKTVTRNVKVAMSALKTVCDTRVDFVIFADANFKAYCVQNFDKDGDGEVSLEEGKAVTAIDVNTDDIESLDGIQYFPNLSRLKCCGSTSSSGKLRSLDLSKNTALTNVFCDYNQITVLDVSKNTALKTLRCSCNKLTSLDVSNNTALTTLSCYDNQLEILDVSKNTALETLNCHFNPYLKEIWLNAGQTILNFRYDEDVATVKYRGACEAVDLGLPSGIKWASFNLGASKPEEYGGYYQWAGLEDVTDTSIFLNWSNCPYHTGSNFFHDWTKYIPSYQSSYWSGAGSPDNKTVLDPEDDVAHAKLGDKWRMPTEAEFSELRSNCSVEWTTLNGVEGMKFTSNKNGSSIFLPAVGFREYNHIFRVSSFGYYWSLSLYPEDPYNAYCLDISPDGVSTGHYSRYFGLPVRPVYGPSGQQSGKINEGFITDPEQGWN